jgi:hypothetical protein
MRLRTRHLIVSLGPAHVLASVLAQFLPILGAPVKNTHLRSDGYDRHVFFNENLCSLTRASCRALIGIMLRTCL